ncbi:calpain-like protease ory [Diplodia corticola]|uniref:Calpain-like protease ory n=1 Tax=Diplodia corticola TaxID=236234 RepID=A0A1J9R032_9PEZI|nr:calpain-like protease ory [Diplodia corticola]OJD34718.1 calpain-like protease ory [Diplodia corticola]
MASQQARVAAMTAEMEALQARIAGAPTRDEALELAIKAAELCMRALKVATDKRQKAGLSSHCQTLLTEAERIKKSPEWPAATLPNISSLSLDSTPSRAPQSSRAISPLTQKPPKIKPEPVSDRALPTSEQILLLKSSKINGSTFPPWKDGPSAADFVLGPGEALFEDDVELRLSPAQLKFFDGWKRAKDALPPPAWAAAGTAEDGPTMIKENRNDMVQDVATDCSVVAGLIAGSARVERGNDQLLSNYLWPYDYSAGVPLLSENGKYVFRMNFNGCWRKVVVDDRLPVSRTTRMLHVLDRQNPSLLWPVLLEKAYLKVRGGYDFPGSSSCTDLWTLCGWIPEQIFLPEADIIPNELWARLFKSFGYGDVLMTVGTGNMSRRAERELGLESQHDYAVLDLKEKNGEKKLLLKNPWAEGTGWRSARRPSYTAEEDAPEPSSDSDEQSLSPGTFWISLEQVFQNFENVYVNWNPALFRYRQDIHFHWDLASSRHVPGCLVNNPQFSLKVQVGEPVWLLLSRHFKDTEVDSMDGGGPPQRSATATPDTISGADSGYYSRLSPETSQTRSESPAHGDLARGYISLYIFDEGGNRVYTSLDALESGAFVSSPQMLLKWKNPSKSTYTVVVEQMELASGAYTFTLSAFSPKRVYLDHAIEKRDHSTKLKSRWNKSTGGGNLHSADFSKNPQFKLSVPQATSLAVLLQVPAESVKVNVVVLYGKGKRMHTVKPRDVVVSSGLYRKHCAYAEMQNVDPGVYTIACSTFESGQEASFELRVDSDVRCQLTPIAQEGAGMLSMQLAQACFNPASNRVAAPVIPRKLVRVKIVAKFVRAFGSHDAPGLQARTRSPLRVTLEIGRGPDRRILISSSGGEYSDAEAGVRTEEVDLRPDMLRQGDMWLVLDRLSGPTTGCSEYYSVELFCDSANGVAVGVWRGWDA